MDESSRIEPPQSNVANTVTFNKRYFTEVVR